MLERLHETERADLAVIFIPWVIVDREFHCGAAAREAGQRNAVAFLMKELGIAACGCLMRAGPIKADGRVVRNQGKKRRRRAMQDQRAGCGIEPGDMFSARGA